MARVQLIEFNEKQYQKSWWKWLLMIGMDLMFIVGTIMQIGYGRSFGNSPMSDTMLIILTFFIILLSIVLLSSYLQTYINDEGVYIKYFPFHLKYKFFSWESIESAKVRSYNPLLEFGGWGIKRSKLRFNNFRLVIKSSICYTVSGSNGLELILKNGKKVMIGTHSPNTLDETLTKLSKKGRIDG